MVEVVGDYLEPSELIIPSRENDNDGAMSGDIKISGGKIWFWDTSGAWEVVTSA